MRHNDGYGVIGRHIGSKCKRIDIRGHGGCGSDIGDASSGIGDADKDARVLQKRLRDCGIVIIVYAELEVNCMSHLA